jgi:phage minor structural protein
LIYILNRHEEVVAVLSNDSPNACPYDKDYFTERLENGMLLHEFECPADHEDAAYIDTDGHAAIQDKKGRLVIFKIRETHDVRDTTGIKRRVFSEGKHLDLIGHIIRPIKLEGVSAKTVLTHVLNGTGWEPGNIEWSGINTFDFQDYPTALAAVHKIAASYPAEILFRVELKGGKIVRKYVDMLLMRGANNGARFEYGQNVLRIARKQNRTDQITAIIGVGKVGQDGVAATFKDISYTFTNDEGTEVTKPVGQDWIGDPDALQRWGVDGQHIMGKLMTEETDPLVILKESWDVLQAKKVPQLSYEMDVSLLDAEVDVGDTVIGKDDFFDPPLLVSARVVEYKQSQTDANNDKVILANFKELTSSDAFEDLRELIRRNQAEWEDNGEGIYKSPTPPTNPTNGQLWIDTSDPIQDVWKRWDASAGVWREGPGGPEGPQGIEGPPGADGQSLFTWVKYADDAAGNGLSDLPDGKEYIGFAYNKTTATESTNAADYSWSLVKGDQGIQGPPGEDGNPTYTWIKYADTPTTGISDSPTGKKYLGIAHNKTIATESTNYADYTWQLMYQEGAMLQDTNYNGWQFDATAGVTITRTDGLVRVVESATDGIKIQKRATTSDPWVDQFYVDTAGNLKIVGDIVGGSIDIDTDVKVGQNLYLEYEYENRFNEKGIVFYDPALGGGHDTRIVGTYLKMDLISDLITLYGDGLDVMSGLTRFWSGTSVYFNGNEPRQSTSENGFCGVGAMTPNNTTSAFAGTGVNFRTKKSYTPSSVTLSPTSNTAPGLVADIRADGFWLYVEGGNFTGAYRYWRGNYTA